jgi:hypothetical protein
MLWFGPGVAARDLGRRRSFADMGQTIPAISVLLLWRTGKAASRRDPVGNLVRRALQNGRN